MGGSNDIAKDPARQERVSFVYFVQQGSDGPVKIGLGADPEARLIELQVGNPDPLYLRVTIPGDVALEGALHRRFGEWHVRGEWFGGGGNSAAILAYAAGLDDVRIDYMGVCGATEVEFTGGARHPIGSDERLDLRKDIERLYRSGHNANEIADVLSVYWSVSGDEVAQELKEMRKQGGWKVGRRPRGQRFLASRGAGL